MLAVSAAIVLFSGFALAHAHSDYWSIGNIGPFLMRNLLLVGAGAQLFGLFEGNPLPGEVNVPLWTLKFEVMCYALLALVLCAARLARAEGRRRSAAIAATVFLMILAASSHAAPPPYHESGVADHLARMGFSFFLGSLAWHARARVALSPAIVAALFLLAFGLTEAALPFAEQAQIAFLAYGTFWLGHFDFGGFRRFVDRQDYSYGIYISGFFVQQAAMAFLGPMEPLHNLAISLPVTIAIAIVSWNGIERPALWLKGRAAGSKNTGPNGEDGCANMNSRYNRPSLKGMT